MAAAGLLKELVISGPDGFQRRLLRPFAATISLLFFQEAGFSSYSSNAVLYGLCQHTKSEEKVCRPDGNVHHFFQLQLHLTALYIFVWIITLYDKLFFKFKNLLIINMFKKKKYVRHTAGANAHDALLLVTNKF